MPTANETGIPQDARSRPDPQAYRPLLAPAFPVER